MTADEFFALPEKEGVKRELSDGVLIEEALELGGANPRHEIVKMNFCRIITVFLLTHDLGLLFAASTFPVNGNLLMPDFTFIAKEHFPLDLSGRAFKVSPDIPIEVISTESASHLEKKIGQYLRAGARAVWVAYPEERIIETFDPDGTSRLLEGDQYLEAPTILPGFREPVSKFFEGLLAQD